MEASAGLKLKGSAQVNPTGLIPQFCWGRNQCSLVPQDHSSAPRPSPKASSMKPVPWGCSAGLWTISSSLGFRVLSLDPLDLTRSSPPVSDQGGHAHQSPTSGFTMFSERRGSCCQGHAHRETSRPRGPAQAMGTAPPPPNCRPASGAQRPSTPPTRAPQPLQGPAQAIFLSATQNCLPPLLRARSHSDPLPSPAPCILTDSGCQS